MTRGRRRSPKAAAKSAPRPALENLERRLVPAPVPLAALNLPAQTFIGENLAFTVSFDNSSATETGYGPYVDLYLPVTGIDGAGAAADDGLDFLGATYLGAPVTATQLTLTNGGVAHPYARDDTGAAVNITPPAGFQAGDKLVVLQLPFGSFTPTQPTANLQVTTSLSNLADLGQALPVRAAGGFQFGADPLDNPAADPSILGAAGSATTTPTLLTLRKTYSGPENETATGPNFPRQYTITVDVADGQTLTNLDVSDLLPGNMAFLSVDSSSPAGSTVTATPTVGSAANSPNNRLTVNFPTVAGGAGSNDATVTLSYFIPRLDANNQPVLSPSTGAAATSVNDARAQGDWTPVDGRDPATPAVSDATANDHTLTDRSLAIQKTVAVVNDLGAPGATPGDTLEYTLTLQVSDYFAFANLAVLDTLSDGQRYDATFTPTLQVNGNPFTLAAADFDPGNVTVTPNFSNPADGNSGDGTDGTTGIQFNVAGEMFTRGEDGMLLGGLVDPAGGLLGSAFGDGPTTATIKFRTVIQEEFSDAFPAPNNVVNQGDALSNAVVVQGDVLDNTTLLPTGSTVTDTSAAGVTITTSTLAKSIYAINGNTTLPNPLVVTPGDTVTYRLRYDLTTSDVENLVFSDFLPLPVFNAASVTAFSNTSSATAPAAGAARLGPADTFHTLFPGVVPAVTSDVTNGNNTVVFTYGKNTAPLNQASVVDILFTVQVGGQPFADRLFLTNQARSSEQSTAQFNGAGSFTLDAINQIILAEPVLSIRKGVVATDNPAGVFSPANVGPSGVTFNAPGSATSFTGTVTSAGLAARPVNSDLGGIDAGDLVTFAVVIENTGSGLRGAYDVRVRDTLPAGFAVPGGGLNLQVRDGTGATFTTTNLGGGLFGTGLEIDDPGPTAMPTAALDPGKDASGATINTGRNILVITYDLEAVATVAPRQAVTNTATLFNYASLEGGPDFTGTGDLADAATVTVAAPTAVKTLVSTEITSNGNGASQVVLGEFVNYQLVVTIPEGVTPGATIVDTLPAGLAFVTQTGFTNSDMTDVTFAGATMPAVSNNGQTLTWTLGDVTNADRDDAVSETLTFTYRVVVLNVAGNQETPGPATTLRNSAVFSWTGQSLSPAQAAAVTVVEPQVSVTHSVQVNGVTNGTGDAGDPVVYTITLSNPGTIDAFDVVLANPLPQAAGGASLLTNPTITAVTDTGAVVMMADFELVGANATGWTLQTVAGSVNLLDLLGNSNRTVTITVSGTLSTAVTPGQTVASTATARFSSLDDDPGTRSAHNTAAVERTGADGVNGALNDYAVAATASFTAVTPAPAKSVAFTSEASTAGQQVTVGEVVRYRLVTRLAEGSAPGFQIQDRLPGGLQFLNDGTARLALVANDGGIASSTLGVVPAVTGNETTVAGIVPTYVLPGGAVTGGPFGSGTDPVFNLGDLTNTDSDSDQEFIVLEFNALVLNVAGNVAGTDLANDYLVLVGGAAVGSPSNAVTVRVAEPNLTVTKSVLSTGRDALDPVNYRVLVTNANGADDTAAFDVRVADLLPATLTLNLASVTVTLSGGAVGLTNSSAGNNLDLVVATFPAGGSIQVDYTAAIAATAAPGQTLGNTANVAYTSLPGAQGTTANATGSATPGAPGSATGERDGSGGLNDNTTSANQSVTVNSNSLTGFVYYDSDNDGIRQVGDTGISGVNILLTGMDHLGNAVTLLATTGMTGAYTFTGLRPGTYAVGEPMQPATHLDGQEAAGMTFGGTAGSDTITGITIPAQSNATGTDYNFGELLPATLSGFVYVDANEDGLRQVAEAGLANVTVSLSGTDDRDNPVTAAALTDGTGAYTFPGLRPGTYSVSQPSQPAGFLDGRETRGNVTALAGSIGTDTISAISLTPGGTAGDNNFGELSPASLAGLVFRDDNNDGTRQMSEPGLAGVPVTLTGTDDLMQPVNLMATTAAGGTFSFTNLRPGTYTVTETQPVAYNDGLDAAGSAGGTAGNDVVSGIGLAAGTAATGYTFGERGVTLSGTVFIDADVDGLLDAGEQGLVGVGLELRDVGNNLVATAGTAADGTYSFSGVAAGNYTIVQAQPVGYGSSTANTRAVSLTLTDLTGQDFGETTASLSGSVYNDRNNDGVRQAGEPGIAGVTVTLMGTDALNQPVNRVATTAADGSYSFTGLLSGTYALTETQPLAYSDGLDLAGTAGGTVGNDSIIEIALGAGQNASGYVFGERGTAISGTVFVDANRNMILDAGEAGLGGVVITLVDSLFNPQGTATTAADGTYSFTDLPAGDYLLTETQPAGYGSSTLNTLLVTLTTAGQAGLNFGETTSGLSGTVFRDDDNDGTQDPGEPGLAGVTVTLTGTDASGGAVNANAMTATDGTYQFTGLLSGTYALSETQPAAYNDGLDQAGSAGGTVGNDTVTAIALGAGVDAPGYTFGEQGASLSGAVFVDRNRNGTLDAGEPGLGGVTLLLCDALGNHLATTVSAGDGTYRFDNLPAGEYTVAETQPTGYGSSTTDARVVMLSLGGATGQDFGETTASLAGSVFRDDDNDGVRDAGEPGLAGVTVTLTGLDVLGAPVNAPAVTLADGSYTFTDLLAGNYTLTETQPAAYNDGLDAVGSAGGTPGNDQLGDINLGAGAVATGYTFGERGVGITGTVFHDRTRNGTLDAGDPGLGGVTLTLLDGNGMTVATATSAADGTYRFDNLAAGSYTVVETQPVGYGSSTANSVPVNLTLAGATGVHFGETTSTLGGIVFRDDDNDAFLDVTEPGIPGVVVALTGTSADGAAVSLAQETDADGFYLFTDLLAGTYTLTETQPAAYNDGLDAVGSAGGTLGNDVISAIPLGAGVDEDFYDFGERGTFLGGLVFVDANANGVADAGEPGLAGVTLGLLDGQGNLIDATVTEADGFYFFLNLPAGDYGLLQVQPIGYGSSTPNSLSVTLPLAGLDTVDFGETTSSLSGIVYRDDNGDGAYQDTEPGIAGVQITLTGTDATGQAINRTLGTAADGSYSFTGLLLGLYNLEEAQPADYNDGQDAAGTADGLVENDRVSGIQLFSGIDATGYTFGETGVSLSGTVFVDADGDGTLDAGEAGLGGETVTLQDVNGNPVAVAMTAADGTYHFDNLPAGSYTLVQTQPLGYGSSTPNTIPVNLTLAGLTGQNFGETASLISGTVYLDRDNDGAQDAGEQGIAGVTVTLSGINVRGAAVNQAAVTGPDGAYQFLGLLAGTYTLTETQPAAYLDGLDAAGSAGGTVANDSVSAINLGAGTTATGYLFGERGVGLSGTVYVDLDKNGTRAATENGLGGVDVAVRDAQGTVVARATTGADGSYAFAHLPAGNYSLVQTQPAGYGSSTPNVLPVALPLGGLTGQDFGETTASLAGTVFLDVDGNGVQDFNDQGIVGVSVTLTGTSVLGLPVNVTTLTGPGGNYLFTGLLAGGYTVTETQPAGFDDGTDQAGTFGGAAGNDVVSGINLPGGAVATGYTFAERGTILRGVVYVDTDRDGFRAPGDPVLGGIPIHLRDANGNLVAVTATAADGSYLFANLAPGDYRVLETQPNGYGSSTPNAVVLTVPAGGAAGESFGETLSTLSGAVYVDANNNGARDAGEPGIPGVGVALTGTDANGLVVNRTAVTAADGTYQFTGLLSGTYALTADQPAGFLDGQDAAGTVNGSATGTAGNDQVTGITLGAGADGINYLFGEQNPAGRAFLAGTVFLDTDLDGTRGASEAGLAGVLLTLRDPDGNLVATATTDQAGRYTFLNVVPGPYTLTETQPVGYGSSTADLLGLTVPANGLAGQDFGDTTGRLSGVVYLDLDGNGTRGAEPGVGGVSVHLSGTDATGVPVGRSTVTAADGFYEFTNLLAGTYRITEIQPGNLLDGLDLVGSLGGGNATNDVFDGINVGAGQSGNSYLFGEQNVPAASLGGSAYVDLNNNGVRDAGEPGVAGVTVNLQDGQGNPVATTVTGADGSYLFPGLTAGTYALTEIQPAGLLDGLEALGTAGGTAGNDLFSGIQLSTGANATGYTFGERSQPGTGAVAGRVFLDADRDQVPATTEAGLPGLTVELRDAGGSVLARNLTGADGSYGFPNLAPGNYTVLTFPPNGYGASTALQAAVTVPADGSAAAHFGLTTASLSGFVFRDLSTVPAHINDGLFQPAEGEAGVPGVVVTLTGVDVAGAAVLRTAVTGADGSYHFTGLLQGIYAVAAATPAGFFDGRESAGNFGGDTSVNDRIAAINLGAGAVGTAYNFAELPPADPNGYVFSDDNNNGVRDPGEPGIEGVPVRVTGFAVDPNDASNVIYFDQTMTTDGRGFYAFTILPPSAPGQIDPRSGREGYTTTAAQPAGFLDGREQNGSPPAVVGNDIFSGLFLAPNGFGSDYNFGEVRPVSVLGFAYIDRDNDGSLNGIDTPLLGVVITLTGTDDQGNAVTLGTATAADGSYSFTNLRPGTYTITETQPAGLIDGLETAGSLSPTILNDQFIVTLLPGQVAFDYCFGELPTGTVRGFGSSLATPTTATFPLVSAAPVSKSGLLASTPGNFAAEVRFLNNLYNDLLNRAPDTAGLSGWLTQLGNGATRADVARAIWRSAEHRALQVDRYYQTYLDRASTASERAFWAGVFVAGASETDVALAFLNSEEYRILHPDSGNFVTGLYLDVLGRAPDAAGQAAWMQMLEGGTSRTAVARAFFASTETRLGVLGAFYGQFLRRTPDAAGQATFLSLLARGGTVEDVAVTILSSPEFVARV